MKNKGFTIVESLVAISILILVIAGAASAIQTGISSYIISKDQIIAFYLAQEGFEQIRNIRDENTLKGQDWLTGISVVVSGTGTPCGTTNSCMVEPAVSNVATTCTGVFGACPVLRQDPVSGFYGYNPSWTQTAFTRTINVTTISPTEIAVSVKVNWRKGSVSRQFMIRSNLFDWQ